MKSRARVVTIAAVLCSVSCVAILHVLRTDLPPVSHRLSEYANGPYGWMMTIAFVALGCGLTALGVVLQTRSDPDVIAWTIPATAFLAAAGTVVSGAFRTGVSPASEVIHSRASAIAVVAVVVLALAYSIPIASPRRRVTPDPVGTILALTAAALAAVSPIFHETGLTGLSQRLLWIALTAWVLRVAWRRAERWDNEASLVEGRT